MRKKMSIKFIVNYIFKHIQSVYVYATIVKVMRILLKLAVKLKNLSKPQVSG